MKGIVFTEFFDFVEEHHGYEMVDWLIEETQPESQGVYTAIGSYPFSEMLNYVIAFHRKTGVEINEALRLFGHHLFSGFYKNYGFFFKQSESCFDFLSSIDTYIHIEVAKLYPDAELPRFSVNRIDSNAIEMFYQSRRKLAHLALGLIEKALEHYGEKADIQMEMLNSDGSEVKFTIQKH